MKGMKLTTTEAMFFSISPENMTNTFEKKIESCIFIYSSGNKIQISHLSFAAMLLCETKLITKVSQRVVQPINSGVGLKTHKVQYKYAMHHFYGAAM
jgi:hypothetical protein